MSKAISSFFASLFLVSALNASDEKIDDFKSILDDANHVVTKKLINVDYLPSVITVIDASTFLDAGVQNVGEAIGMLPGIQIQLNFIGQPIIKVRGFANPNSMLSDKIKILVDGVAINNEASGNSGYYLDFPLQLVQRIEVLRGPGSTQYGAGAFFGAINVITKLGERSEENQLFAGVGSYKYKTTSANLNSDYGDWKMFADGYYAQNDKSIANGDETTDEAMKSLSLGFKLVNGGFEFLTRYKESHYGNFFQNKGDIEPNHDDGHKESYFFSQLSHKTYLGDFKLETKANFSNRESDIAAYFTTDVNQIAAAFNVVGVDMQEAFHVRDHQMEQNIGVEAILTLPKFLSNNVSIGVGARRAHLSVNDFYSSVENAIAQNLNDIQAHPLYSFFPFNATEEPAFWEIPQAPTFLARRREPFLTRTFKISYL